MPSLRRTTTMAESARRPSTSADRFTRALLDLTRVVWHPGCTFESAIAAICRTACAALQVERVSMWAYEPEARLLRCLHAHQSHGSGPLDTASLDTLSLDGDDYIAALSDVRALDTSDFDGTDGNPLSHQALREYLQRYSIHALLDAPACVGGNLLGVISHECVDRRRDWSAEEVTFAASMGDYVAMAYEIARRCTAEKTVRHLLLHDAATGLPNRAYVEELLAQRLASRTRMGESVAVVHARIDVACGAALADGAPTEAEVMTRIASRLRALEGAKVDLARAHSNGFAFVLACPHVQAAAVALAEQCLQLVRDTGEHCGDVHPGAAVGIAFADATPGLDARRLLLQAEEAADSAANTDKFAVDVFDVGRHDALVQRLRTERALRLAFAKDEFELHYQPEYDATGHQWVAAEALLRWRHDGRLLSAGEFVGVAEESGLIVPLGSWVLHRACRDAAVWPALPDGALAGVRVNVSTRQFESSGLADDVATALARSGLAAERLCLEITESTLMGNIDKVRTVLTRLREIGVLVAIDDFGTGFASLTYLKRLPVDVLKIDRSFVEGLPGDRIDAAIVAAVVGLAASLEIEVVAEGVEQLEQQRALQAIGVRRMQGWLYARAMDQDSICRLLSSTPQHPRHPPQNA